MDEYMKPNLPFTIKVRAEHPDNSTYGVRMKALNCRVNIRSAELSKDLTHYFSSSNSSLLIFAPKDTLKCAAAGQAAARHTLPVFFSARDQPTAAIKVQIVS
ncbi:hypothetical protein Pcinc_012336 [Petrolisthes cinctipes]|uniref:Uncharacterized protein n=1 Tax=Petrolisthes cinctipes TaxID=88211 RepID=A0AAE1KSM8_PETCI|nr:hypothetical protein Pcinc_012336 [Petrolisthes cinctipes]